MTELLTAAEMRALERAAIESGEVTGLELMERAGRGVVEAVFAEWPELAGGLHRAVVLCGPGNNGGDGFVVARILHERDWDVEVFLYGDPDKLPPDARANHARWSSGGSPVRSVADLALFDPSGATLLVDAVFGIGLTRQLEGERLEAFLRPTGLAAEELPPSSADPVAGTPPLRTVAIDVPSGLCADSGKVLRGDHFDATVAGANLTVSFQRPKPGHYLGDGPGLCRRLRVVDIGLSRWSVRPTVTLASPAQGVSLKRVGAHKYDHGHALVLSGGPGKGGAARLAARGALRIGAGLVTLGCPPAALQENAAQLNAIMLRSVRDAEHLTQMLRDERLNAVCLGPGFGLGEGARAMVAAALGAERGTVLDGDALTAFTDDPAQLFALTHEKVVLTPHAGEFKRLFPDLAEKLAEPPTKGPAYSKVDATREAAARAGCVVLYKGPDTVIAGPDGRAAINAAAYDRAAPWLATAGAGDVLAGFVTGLLARGLAPMEAAESAAWLHVECALAFGPGLIAEDLPDALPAVFRPPARGPAARASPAREG